MKESRRWWGKYSLGGSRIWLCGREHMAAYYLVPGGVSVTGGGTMVFTRDSRGGVST